MEPGSPTYRPASPSGIYQDLRPVYNVLSRERAQRVAAGCLWYVNEYIPRLIPEFSPPPFTVRPGHFLFELDDLSRHEDVGRELFNCLCLMVEGRRALFVPFLTFPNRPELRYQSVHNNTNNIVALELVQCVAGSHDPGLDRPNTYFTQLQRQGQDRLQCMAVHDSWQLLRGSAQEEDASMSPRYWGAVRVRRGNSLYAEDGIQFEGW